MKRQLALLILMVASQGSIANELNIVAATNDLGAIASAVGGEYVNIDVVARPDRDPHTVEVRPSAMRKTAKANIYLSVGMSLDLWSRDIVRGSRNKALILIDCSHAVEPLEAPTGKIDASMGDVHPEGNPHYWLDPRNGAAVARLLSDRFADQDPAHQEEYAANASAFVAQLESRFPGWEARLRGQRFVEFHRSWAYLSHCFGMEILGQVEPVPGIPATARHLTALAEVIEHTQVPVVIRESYHSESSISFLERETGIRGMVLPASCDDPTPESYIAHFDRIADVLGVIPSRGDQP